MSKYKGNKTNYSIIAGLIAAAYAALTYISAGLGIAYNAIQFRISDALMCLAMFTPAAVPGLTIGCILGNLTSPYGLIDIVMGTAATLVGALIIRLLAKSGVKYAFLLMPIVSALSNGIIVGLELTFFLPGEAGLPGFLLCGAQVAAGELVVCYLIGIPLYFILNKYKKVIFKDQ